MVMKNISLIFLFLFTLSVYSQDVPLIPYKKGNSWGYCDTLGIISIEPKFDKADFFSGLHARVVSNNKVGYIDENGKFIFEAKYDDVRPHHPVKLYEVKQNGKWGLVRGNKEITTIHYDTIKCLDENIFLVKRNGKYGVISAADKKVRKLIPFEYDQIRYLHWKKEFKCDKGETTIKIDQTGAIIPENISQPDEEVYEMPDMELDVEEAFFTRFIPFESNGEKGLIIRDKSRRIGSYNQIVLDTIPAIYDEILFDKWYSDCYIVRLDSLWGAVNLKNEIYIPLEYEDIDMKMLSFQNSSTPYKQLFTVKKNGKWGMIGSHTEFRKIPDHYDIALPFNYDEISQGTRHYILQIDTGYGIALRKGLKIITETKYFKISHKCKSVGRFYVFFIEDESGEVKYVGENGIEYFE